MGSDGCRSSTKDLTGKTEKYVTIHSNKKESHLRMKVTKFVGQVLQDSCVCIGICVYYRVFDLYTSINGVKNTMCYKKF